MPIQVNKENSGKMLVIHVSGKLEKSDYEVSLRTHRGDNFGGFMGSHPQGADLVLCGHRDLELDASDWRG